MEKWGGVDGDVCRRAHRMQPTFGFREIVIVEHFQRRSITEAPVGHSVNHVEHREEWSGCDQQ